MNRYKEFTDQIYLLYKSFIESGFTDYQACELTEAYCKEAYFRSIFIPKKRSGQELYMNYYNTIREHGDIFKNNKED